LIAVTSTTGWINNVKLTWIWRIYECKYVYIWIWIFCQRYIITRIEKSHDLYSSVTDLNTLLYIDTCFIHNERHQEHSYYILTQEYTAIQKNMNIFHQMEIRLIYTHLKD
jgi:hypothetical protein